MNHDPRESAEQPHNLDESITASDVSKATELLTNKDVPLQEGVPEGRFQHENKTNKKKPSQPPTRA